MVRHTPVTTSKAKRPAVKIAVAVMLTVAIMGSLWVPIFARSQPKLGGFPVLLLVPAHPGAGDLRAVLDLLPAAADQAGRAPSRRARRAGSAAMNHVNAVTFTILVASFLLVTSSASPRPGGARPRTRCT